MSEKTPRTKSPKPKAETAPESVTPEPIAPELVAPESLTAEERFIADLLARGEAARRDKDGNLPPGATHEIVDDPKGGPAKLVRVRFSIS